MISILSNFNEVLRILLIIIFFIEFYLPVIKQRYSLSMARLEDTNFHGYLMATSVILMDHDESGTALSEGF